MLKEGFEEVQPDTSTYWYYILPSIIILLCLFFVYILFHVSSIQLVGQERVFQIIKNITHN